MDCCHIFGKFIHQSEIVDLLLKHFIPLQFIDYRENSDVSRDDVLKYGTAILLATISSGMCTLHFFYFSSYYGGRIRVAVCSLIYRKVLPLYI